MISENKQCVAQLVELEIECMDAGYRSQSC